MNMRVALGLWSVLAVPVQAESDNFWGLALGARIATIPYASAVDEQASDFVPWLFAETEHVSVEGTGLTLHAWQSDYGKLGVTGRYRFLDLPEDMQPQREAETFDYGLRWEGPLTAEQRYRLEWLSERYGRMQGIAEWRGQWRWQGLTVEPVAGARWRDADFTSQYYGLGLVDGDAGIDPHAGFSARWQLWRELYLYGGANWRYLSNSVTDLATIDDRWQAEYQLGLAFFNEPDRKLKGTANDLGRHYWRLSHGWATPSNLGDMLSFNTVSDKEDNQLSSLFYGYRLSRQLLGFDIDSYLTPGVVWHHESDVQNAGSEYVVALKLYWTYSWPTRWRFGLAEGISYVSKITWIERVEMEEKGYEPSKLMNYLDLSADVNIGDLFNAPSFNSWWFGYGIHHRSAVLETASQFGNIKGGSNYQTLYLQWDF